MHPLFTIGMQAGRSAAARPASASTATIYADTCGCPRRTASILRVSQQPAWSRTAADAAALRIYLSYPSRTRWRWRPPSRAPHWRPPPASRSALAATAGVALLPPDKMEDALFRSCRPISVPESFSLSCCEHMYFPSFKVCLASVTIRTAATRLPQWRAA